MKKFNFLLLLSFLMLAPVSFTSCSDDEEEGGGGSASELVGNWEMVSSIAIYKENGVVVQEIDETEEGIFTFHADGRLSHNGDEFAKWSYKNGKLTLMYPEEGSEGDYEEGYDVVLPVKELTNSKLLIEVNYKGIEDGITYETYYRMEWRKVSK